MTAIAKAQQNTEKLEQALITGDLSTMTPADRLHYYKQTCDSLGLNPLTKPFEYVKLNGKLTLYARKDATDQLRKIHCISIAEPTIRFEDEWIVVTVLASTPEGRTDSDIGVVSKKDMQGNFGNALMKAVTKSKRRVTLSICGLGILDETEVETIPNAQTFTDEPEPATKFLKRVESTAPDAPAEPVKWGAKIKQLCQDLNDAGDSISWGKASLTGYCRDLFGDDDITDVTALDPEQLSFLAEDLEGRLKDING